MGRLRKCVICNENIGADEISVPYKKRYAHQRCFNIAMKTLQKDKSEQIEKVCEQKKSGRKPKAELKDALSEEEYVNKQKYYQYLKMLVDDNKLSAKIYVLSEDYIKRYNFTYENMYKTLVYLHEILEKELTGDIVGLIPYYYSEAMQYYSSVERIVEINKNADISQMYKEKTIIIQPKHKKIKQIDITSIGGEAD